MVGVLSGETTNLACELSKCVFEPVQCHDDENYACLRKMSVVASIRSRQICRTAPNMGVGYRLWAGYGAIPVSKLKRNHMVSNCLSDADVFPIVLRSSSTITGGAFEGL